MDLSKNYNMLDYPRTSFEYNRFNANRFNPRGYDADFSIEEDPCYLEYVAMSEFYDTYRMEL